MTLGAPPKPKTKPGTRQRSDVDGRRLSEVARHVVQPSGIVSTGWPAVRDTCGSLGVGFDRWQDGIGRLILAKNADDLYATDTIVISIPRQVGKTYLIGWIVFALCIKFPGLTVLWTAHRYKTAGETYRSLAAMANRQKMQPHVDSTPRGAGDQAINFTNESRIMFGARERGFGRGFADVDVEIFDETQILTQNAIDDMVPATSTAANPLIVYMGTPPKPADPGEVFTEFRERALSGDSEDVLYVEISADPDAKPLDREQWRRANPSYPHRTPERSMLRMFKNLTAESFLREGLGVWDVNASSRVVNLDVWAELTDPASVASSFTAFAVEMTPDRVWASVAGAGPRADGLTHVEVQHGDPGGSTHRRGSGWVVPYCVAMHERHGRPVFVVDGGGPAATLIGDLEAAGLNVMVVGAQDMARAFGMLMDAVADRSFRHGPQQELVDAIQVAKTRPCGDGGTAFGRKVSGADISALVAVKLAHWAAKAAPVAAPQVWSLSEMVAQIRAENGAAPAEGGETSADAGHSEAPEAGAVARADGSRFVPIR